MDKKTEYFTVSQVADVTGVTAAQLKNWDKTGVLVAKRTGDGVANNRKLYSRDDIDTVQEILLYRSLGFGLEEIKEHTQRDARRACPIGLQSREKAQVGLLDHPKADRARFGTRGFLA